MNSWLYQISWDHFNIFAFIDVGNQQTLIDHHLEFMNVQIVSVTPLYRKKVSVTPEAENYQYSILLMFMYALLIFDVLSLPFSK
jgi:hypothetical protein